MPKKLMLCNPENVRAIISATNSGYSYDDPKFVGCIAMASEMIEKYTRRNLRYGTGTDVFDIPANVSRVFRLYTSGIPLDGSSVSARSGRQADWSLPNADIATSIFVLDPANGVLGITGSGSEKSQLIVSYKAGFHPLEEQPTKWGDDLEFLDVPNDLQFAAATQASFLMQRLMKNDTGKRGDEGSSVAKESVMNLAPDAGKYLDKYIRPRYMGAR